MEWIRLTIGVLLTVMMVFTLKTCWHLRRATDDLLAADECQQRLIRLLTDRVEVLERRDG